MKPINKFQDTGDTLNILVVEDNPGDYALVEDFLFELKNEFNLKHAQTCKEAKAMLSDVHNSILMLSFWICIY